jgi:hypothetical protein
MEFKRNQVEAAICQTFDARDERAHELKLRLKRLLVTDRRLGRRLKSNDEADRHFAFYSEEPPGSGIEVMFSAYEAFAQLAGIMLLEHGLPQARAVRVMRQARRQLEADHARTLRKDPHRLSDQQAILAQAKPGMIATGTTDPVYLVFVRVTDSSVGDRRGGLPVAVCHSQSEAMAFMYKHSDLGPGVTIFEFSRLMRTLADNLSHTRPVKRGRSTV